MDCEKCEELLLDELYGELDDVTSAAVRRHVAGCAHCSEIFADLKSTREMVSSMPIIAVPPSLEERIFAAEKESRKGVPLRGVSRFVSVAGRWAMRPQTAMAALFLLMIGSTTFFLKGRNPNHASSIVVAQEGAPMSADQTPASTESLAPNAARGAHGPLELKPQATPPPAAVALGGAAASAAPMPAATTAVAMDDSEKDRDGDESKNAPADMRRATPRKVARSANDPNSNGLDDMTASNAAAPAGAPPQQQAMNIPPPPPPAPAAKSLEQARGDLAAANSVAGPSGNTGGYYSQQPGATAAGGGAAFKKEDNANGSDAFAQGKSAYQNGQYPAATQSFDRAAQGGDVNASLWSARATRQGPGGCAAAIPKFNAVTSRVGLSGVGADAAYESAQCSAQLGQVDVARAKYTQLLGTQAYATTAQQQLNALNQVATRHASEAQKKASASTPAAAAAPQPAAKPAAPAATALDNNTK